MEKIRNDVLVRRITRLCHFTPSNNLLHILTHERGIMPTYEVIIDGDIPYNPTDVNRYDQHTKYVCCSIQYPNVWFFEKARLREELFEDWVVLFIKPFYLWRKGIKFCSVNASTKRGYYIGEGFNAYSQLFINNPPGSRNTRSNKHLPFCPTDDQAEVLVFGNIELCDIMGIAVKDETQLKNELSRLKILKESLKVDLRQINFFIVPTFYDKFKLSNSIRRGILVEETKYEV